MGPFLILKFLSGFNIFNGEKLGKLVFYAILIIIGIGIYHKTFVAPTIKNIQKTTIQHVENYYQSQDSKRNNDKFIGVKVWKFKGGVSW